MADAAGAIFDSSILQNHDPVPARHWIGVSDQTGAACVQSPEVDYLYHPTGRWRYEAARQTILVGGAQNTGGDTNHYLSMCSRGIENLGGEVTMPYPGVVAACFGLHSGGSMGATDYTTIGLMKNGAEVTGPSWPPGSWYSSAHPDPILIIGRQWDSAGTDTGVQWAWRQDLPPNYCNFEAGDSIGMVMANSGSAGGLDLMAALHCVFGVDW